MTHLDFLNKTKIGTVVKFNRKRHKNYGLYGIVVYIDYETKKDCFGHYIDNNILLIRAINDEKMFWNDNSHKYCKRLELVDWRNVELVPEEA